MDFGILENKLAIVGIMLIFASAFGCEKRDTEALERPKRAEKDSVEIEARDHHNSLEGDGGQSSPMKFDKHWWLVVTRAIGDVDDDSRIILGGAWIGGPVTVYVNGSPLYLHCFGGKATRITEWLQPGKNEIRCTGQHEKELFVKVYTSPQATVESLLGVEILETVTKGYFSPDANSFELSFKADVPQIDLFDDLGAIDDKTRALFRKELATKIGQLEQAIHQHDEVAITNSLLNNGQKLYIVPPNERLEEQQQKEYERLLGNPALRIVESRAPFRFIWGAKSVLVYKGIDESLEPVPGAYVFQFEGGELSYLQPLRFVRTNDTWYFW